MKKQNPVKSDNIKIIPTGTGGATHIIGGYAMKESEYYKQKITELLDGITQIYILALIYRYIKNIVKED